MEIIIIPGFTGHPDEITFKDLGETLTRLGHNVTKVAWPGFPDDLDKYSFTSMIAHCREILKDTDPDRLVLLGFSMGGIIATMLAAEFNPRKLGLTVSPYQAATQDDLEGKYKEWKETGFRTLSSSKYGELTIPFSFIEDARRYNALEYIDRVKCPVLFVVAENDEKISITASQKFFERANEPKTWQVIKEAAHRYQYQPEMLLRANQIIIDFVQSDTGS